MVSVLSISKHDLRYLPYVAYNVTWIPKQHIPSKQEQQEQTLRFLQKVDWLFPWIPIDIPLITFWNTSIFSPKTPPPPKKTTNPSEVEEMDASPEKKWRKVFQVTNLLRGAKNTFNLKSAKLNFRVCIRFFHSKKPVTFLVTRNCCSDYTDLCELGSGSKTMATRTASSQPITGIPFFGIQVIFSVVKSS